MTHRVCPKCNKAFFHAAGGECRPPCPYCGYVLVEQRRHGRLEAKVDFEFYDCGVRRVATLVDFSADGARIIYEGKELSGDTDLEINVGELKIRRLARLVWTRSLGGSALQTGLEFSQKAG